MAKKANRRMQIGGWGFAPMPATMTFARNLQTDRLGYEQFIRDVLESPLLTEGQKLLMIAEATGAFTGRGNPRIPTATEEN